MKINPRMFTDIKAILPGFSSITGCDTAYYSFGVGQIGPFKKIATSWQNGFVARYGNTCSLI